MCPHLWVLVWGHWVGHRPRQVGVGGEHGGGAGSASKPFPHHFLGFRLVTPTNLRKNPTLGGNPHGLTPGADKWRCSAPSQQPETQTQLSPK